MKFVLEQDDKKDDAIFLQSDDNLEINYFKENNIGKDEYEKEEQQGTHNEIKKEEEEIERKKKKVTQKRKIVEVDKKMIAQRSSVNTQVS